MRKLWLFKWTVMTCALALAIESCSANVAPTLTPTIAPTITPTNTPTETPIPPTSTPGPPAELSKEDYKSNIDELTDMQLKEEWQRLRVAFPNAEIYMTERGEICIFNSKDALLCGQVIQGKSGSTFTYLITPTVSWEIRVNLRQISKDNVQALNTIFIPDMVNNAEKDEILRIVETLLDLDERIITVKEDLATYESSQPPRHLIATFCGYEEEASIIGVFAKDIFHNYEGYELYSKNPNPGNNPPFWELDVADQNLKILLKRKFSRIVKAEDGTFVYAHFQSGFTNFEIPQGNSVEQVIAFQILSNTLDELIRDYLNKRGEMTGKTFVNPRSSTKFKHLFDNYPPLSIEYWKVATADGNLSEEEQVAAEFYTTDSIRVLVDSFAKSP